MEHSGSNPTLPSCLEGLETLKIDCPFVNFGQKLYREAKCFYPQSCTTVQFAVPLNLDEVSIVGGFAKFGSSYAKFGDNSANLSRGFYSWRFF